jgi:hypothetical protein
MAETIQTLPAFEGGVTMPEGRIVPPAAGDHGIYNNRHEFSRQQMEWGLQTVKSMIASLLAEEADGPKKEELRAVAKDEVAVATLTLYFLEISRNVMRKPPACA